MTPSHTSHGRLISGEHRRCDGFPEGLLTCQDGGDARVAVRIGPRSAWRPDAQALLAGLAGDLEDPVLRTADGRDRHGMIIVDDFPAGVVHKLCELFAELHRTLVTLIEHVESDVKFKGINSGIEIAGGLLGKIPILLIEQRKKVRS
jgi:hypothetical protein